MEAKPGDTVFPGKMPDLSQRQTLTYTPAKQPIRYFH